MTSASLMAFEDRPKFHPDNHNNVKSVEILSQLPVDAQGIRTLGLP